MADSGRGLHIIETLATSWGVVEHAGGLRTVWAALPLPLAATGPAHRPLTAPAAGGTPTPDALGSAPVSKKSRRLAPSSTPTVAAGEPVPVVGGREPCPCGSGKRYKGCHGREEREEADPSGRPALRGAAGRVRLGRAARDRPVGHGRRSGRRTEHGAADVTRRDRPADGLARDAPCGRRGLGRAADHERLR